MRERWLARCLLAYPKASRERDGGYLLDLALELGEASGVRRQALSLLRGGLAERVRGVGRRAVLVAGLAQCHAARRRWRGGRRRVCRGRGRGRGRGRPRRSDGHDPSPTRPASIVRFVDRTIPDGASGTLVAMRGDDVVACEGFGLADRAAGVPAGCDTVYDIGSVTKQFTAAAVVKLEMLGRLEVHQPIGHWLGPVPPDKRASRSSSCSPTPRVWSIPSATTTSGSPASAGHSGARLAAAVGARHGVPLLERRLQPAGGDHRAGVRHRLRAVPGPPPVPARAHDAHRLHAAGLAARRRRRRVRRPGLPQGRPFDHPWAASGPWWNLRGNGGMLSTARDLARWHRALLDHRVLDRRAQRQLFRPRVPEQPGGDSWYGYGWVLLDTSVGPVAWHNGGNGWSYAELTRVLGRGGDGLLGHQPGPQQRRRLEPRAPRHPDHRRSGPSAARRAGRPLVTNRPRVSHAVVTACQRSERLVTRARAPRRPCHPAPRRTQGSSSRPARPGRRTGGAALPRTPPECRGPRACRPSRRRPARSSPRSHPSWTAR